MKKILRLSLLLGAISPLVGTSLLTIVSCGHKSSPHSITWNGFKDAATHEKAINIVTAVTPPSWKGATKDQLTLGDFQVNDEDRIIDLTINRKVSTDDVYTGDFQISYIGEKYNVKNWIITKNPIQNPDWLRFQNKAKAETPKTLLALVKKTAIWPRLRWTYGNSTQIVWQANDTAEFDVYGGIDKNDYNMKGNFVVSETYKKISCFISRVGHEGAYDSDPIKAVITFKKDIYNNANWVFSQDTQLQSKAKMMSLFLDVVDKAKKNTKKSPFNFNNFQFTNWADIDVIKGKTPAKIHSSSIHITDLLESSGYTNVIKLAFGIYSSSPAAITHGLQIKIVFNFTAIHVSPYQLSLYFDAYFNNGKNENDGLTPFNYTWSGVLKLLA